MYIMYVYYTFIYYCAQIRMSRYFQDRGLQYIKVLKMLFEFQRNQKSLNGLSYTVTRFNVKYCKPVNIHCIIAKLKIQQIYYDHYLQYYYTVKRPSI